MKREESAWGTRERKENENTELTEYPKSSQKGYLIKHPEGSRNPELAKRERYNTRGKN